ncbi:peptidase M20/M25/M40 family [Renibacterium salmoninarum ATCC 33209]|uniref:Peptidase M20/M25/M40 family n=1 Tax=Renibacterium salmoninarum (strain ATCC 33209 / DSM 20767 / JCM 11484 / NBRC 15589 / NCIMB 2235) TaxID=288705 RepID=A9WSJ6_RENSM|nr:M20/M25/M40 family metallo-hydrolase [Renibacterium salmoninarum]ABY23784.1 peptidase M20/M25/M40 family [Renibacterium salmoninarum ATCC 33209]
MAELSSNQNASEEVIRICRDLIRIDTSNYGDGTGPGERAAAEYTAGLIEEVGLETTIFESAPDRTSVLTRMKGKDSSKGALIVHGHLDVVPAQKEDWSVDPFGAEEKDGLIWGRGAVDMKEMDAMILSVMRSLAREGHQPERDLIFAFFADEEAGGKFGSHWAVENRPELFEGATEAISEVGGYPTEIGGRRTYLLQTAEKGLSWLRLVAHGRAGHGSQINTDNAVTRLAAAVTRIGQYEWPIELTKTTQQFLEGVTELTGVEFDPDNPEEILKELGTVARFVGATLQNTTNPTVLRSGYKHNVIPGTAEALIDARTLPGQQEKVLEIVRELAGTGVEVSCSHQDVDLEVPFSGNLVDSMIDALQAEDPGAKVLPYTLSGGTDNKALSKLGITGYGFAPLQLPLDLDFPAMFHGVDEWVPADSLRFGVRVLDRLLSTY